MYEQNYYGGPQPHHQQSQIGYQNVSQKIHRSVSNSNVSNERSGDCHVEYEVSMPVPIIRHPQPSYHSMWNLHQW
jgi:outer membrane usher protein FimD/PapC